MPRIAYLYHNTFDRWIDFRQLFAMSIHFAWFISHLSYDGTSQSPSIIVEQIEKVVKPLQDEMWERKIGVIYKKCITEIALNATCALTSVCHLGMFDMDVWNLFHLPVAWSEPRYDIQPVGRLHYLDLNNFSSFDVEFQQF